MKTQRPVSLAHLLTPLIFILALAVPAGAQNVPATAREAAALPQLAPRPAHAGGPPHRASAPGHRPSCSPLPQSYGSRKTLPQDWVYDNGPFNGNTDAWQIDYGFGVSDSFTDADNQSIGDLRMVYWTAAGNQLTSVDVAFGSTSFGGTYNTYGVSNNTLRGTNDFGYAIYQADIAFASVPWSGAGFVSLQNACTAGGCSSGEPQIFWDENGGPSTAYENTLGSIPSETFTLTGEGGGNACMPERSRNFKVIYDFTGQDDGGSPAGVAIDKVGNLYGPAQPSTVFQLLKAGSDWVFGTLYHFTGGDRGIAPSGLILGLNGILYGSAYGGLPNCEYGEYCGMIFGLRRRPSACLTGSCSWLESVPYSFTGLTDASGGGGLVSDKAGNLYGISSSGGAQQQGAVFELTPSSGGWIESILYSFTGGSDGGGPTSLLVGNDGNLFGMTGLGGANATGVVFLLTPSASGWTETILFDLPYSMYGSDPHSLIQDSAGNLFGEWQYWYEEPWGSGEWLGVVFMLSPSSGGWIYSELRQGDHQSYTSDVFGTLTPDAAGNLYGTGGGVAGCVNPVYHGYIFELTRSGDGWQYSTPMYWGNTTFDVGGALALDAQGNLYGTTSDCGSHQHGTVWELTTTQ